MMRDKSQILSLLLVLVSNWKRILKQIHETGEVAQELMLSSCTHPHSHHAHPTEEAQHSLGL